MARLPILSSKQIIRVLERCGYYIVRQRGSHIRLNHLSRKPVMVPNYRTIDRSLLYKILRVADISEGEFLKFLK